MRLLENGVVILGYKQLDYKKRCQIFGLWRAGYTQVQIAKEVGTNQSTISRELNRNITFIRTKLGCWQYKPDYAQGYASQRHKNKKKKIKLICEVTNFIRDKIQQKWSPEQISGYAKKHNLFSICKEWIYQFILRDKEKGGKLYLNLRHQNKKYRKRYGSPKRTGPIKNRRFINERPRIVDEKTRVGDWEIDTIIGKQQKQAVISIVERFSKKTILKKVSKRTAISVATATIEGLKAYANSILTITADNGSEFAYHEMISQELKTDFYFAHPYSSWERGLNENTNGLVRQYLKKGSSFTGVTDKELEIVTDYLNNRPRKSLGYSTPNEMTRRNAIKRANATKTNAANITPPVNTETALKAMQTNLKFSTVEAMSLLAKLSAAEVALIPVIAPMLENDLHIIIGHDITMGDPELVTRDKVLQELIEWYPTHSVLDFPEVARNGTRAPSIPDGLVKKLTSAKQFIALCDSAIAFHQPSKNRKHVTPAELGELTNDEYKIIKNKLRDDSELLSHIPQSQIVAHNNDANQLSQAGRLILNNPELVVGGTLLLSLCLVLSVTFARKPIFAARCVKDGINSLRNSRLNFFKKPQPKAEELIEINGLTVHLPDLRGLARPGQ